MPLINKIFLKQGKEEQIMKPKGPFITTKTAKSARSHDKL